MEQNKEFLKLLIDKDMSNTKFAEKIGVSWQTVYYWSIGRNKPSLINVLKMAELLCLSAEELYKMFDVSAKS